MPTPDAVAEGATRRGQTTSNALGRHDATFAASLTPAAWQPAPGRRRGTQACWLPWPDLFNTDSLEGLSTDTSIEIISITFPFLKPALQSNGRLS